MEFLLNHLSCKIRFITHQLEFDQFISKERKALLKKELSSLLFKREKLLEMMPDKQSEIIPNKKDGK